MYLQLPMLRGAQIGAWRRCLECVLAYSDRVDPVLLSLSDATLKRMLKDATLAVNDRRHQLRLGGMKSRNFTRVVITIMLDAHIAPLVAQSDRYMLAELIPRPANWESL